MCRCAGVSKAGDGGDRLTLAGVVAWRWYHESDAAIPAAYQPNDNGQQIWPAHTTAYFTIKRRSPGIPIDH